MTLTFKTFYDGIEVYIEPPSKTELARYKKDSQRNLKAYYYRKHPLAKKMKEWLTLRTFIFLLAAFPLFAAQAHT